MLFFALKPRETEKKRKSGEKLEKSRRKGKCHLFAWLALVIVIFCSSTLKRIFRARTPDLLGPLCQHAAVCLAEICVGSAKCGLSYFAGK